MPNPYASIRDWRPVPIGRLCGRLTGRSREGYVDAFALMRRGRVLRAGDSGRSLCRRRADSFTLTLVHIQ